MENHIISDLRSSVRILRKRPGFTSIAVITLALGIGANTAIFSVVNGLFLRPLPYRDDSHLVALGQSNRKSGLTREGVSPANFFDWREQMQSFEAIAAAEQWGFTLTDYGEPEAIRGWVVTKDFFQILGTSALLGRTLLPDESEQNNAQVVVLSYDLWQRRFGSDPQIIGRKLTLNTQPFTVVGVMPQAFQYPANPELWAPRVSRANDTQQRGGNLFRVVGRLRTGVTIEQAQQEMSNIAAQLSRSYPQTNADVGAVVTPLRELLFGQIRVALYILLGAVSLVLLIACANVAGLLLVRAAERQREFALRAALGASRKRLIQQLLIESLLLSSAGGFSGILVSRLLIAAFVAVSPGSLPLAQIGVNATVLIFAVSVSILSGLIFGLTPALQASRINLQTVLKDGGRSQTTARGRKRIRQILVVSEIALALTVLVGAGLLVRSLVALLHTDPGFTIDNGLTLEVQMGTLQANERTIYVEQVMERIAALPGVQDVAISSAIPFHDHQMALPTQISFADGSTAAAGSEPIACLIKSSEGYFRALRIPLVQGQLFSQHDRGNMPLVTIVNETMARRLWPGESPIGRRISFTTLGQSVTAEIIGIVGDVKPNGFDSEPRQEFYLHYPQSPAPLATFVVRTSGDPTNLLPAVKAKFRELNRNQAFLSVNTIEQLAETTTAYRRFNLLWLGAFALVALVLATVGLYGLISFSTTQRTQEIGVRMALGAQTGDVLRLVMREGITLALIGVAVGLVTVAAASRLMKSLLFGVGPIDALTFASVAALLMLVALMACYLPARRAANVDPLVALRYE
jgi:putative ABC transport system permease protein